MISRSRVTLFAELTTRIPLYALRPYGGNNRPANAVGPAPEMNHAAVINALQSVDPSYATDAPERVELLAALSRIYEAQGVVVRARALALHQACPQRGRCWEGVPEDYRPSKAEVKGCGEPGSICWPWIGKEYRAGGVAVMPIPEQLGIVVEGGISRHRHDFQVPIGSGSWSLPLVTGA